MAISNTADSFLRGRIKLRHLRLMLILDDERSISRAAERLRISQAAVSKTRIEIEEGVGATLFTRIDHRLELTEAGKCVLQAARRIISDLQNLDEEVAVIKSGMRGTVTIGMRSVSAEPFLAYVTTKFKDANPNVTIRIIDSEMSVVLEKLTKSDISLAIGRLDSEHVPEHVDTQFILSDSNVVMASAHHPLVQHSKVDWPEIVRYRWCLSPSGFAGRFSTEHLALHLRHLSLPFPVDLIEPTSFSMHNALMQAGNFITLVPEGVAYALDQRGTAVRLKLPSIGSADPVILMWRSDIPLSPAAKRFRDFTIDTLKTNTGGKMPSDLPRGSTIRKLFAGSTPVTTPRAVKHPALHKTEVRKASV
jgi:DNA-binding transcriptional LysR family regulator